MIARYACVDSNLLLDDIAIFRNVLFKFFTKIVLNVILRYLLTNKKAVLVSISYTVNDFIRSCNDLIMINSISKSETLYVYYLM